MNASLPPSPLNDTQRHQIDALVRELNEQQLDWVQGYLAGYRAALQSAAAPPVDRVDHSPGLTVLYGSQTGNCETLAERLAEQARAKGLKVECLSMDELPNRLLKNARQLAIIVSTHGEGDPPDSALDLHEFVHSRRAPKLGELQYAVLALGDSSYEFFCKTGQDFDERLAALGASRLIDRVDCDVDFDQAAVQWIDRLLERVVKQSPASAAQQTASTPATPASAYNRKSPFQAPVLDRVGLT